MTKGPDTALDPSAGNPAPAKPAPAAATANKPAAAQDPNLAPKDNVNLIGQRNIGGGLDFYSYEREIALGRQLAQEVEGSMVSGCFQSVDETGLGQKKCSGAN